MIDGKGTFDLEPIDGAADGVESLNLQLELIQTTAERNGVANLNRGLELLQRHFQTLQRGALAMARVRPTAVSAPPTARRVEGLRQPAPTFQPTVAQPRASGGGSSGLLTAAVAGGVVAAVARQAQREAVRTVATAAVGPTGPAVTAVARQARSGLDFNKATAEDIAKANLPGLGSDPKGKTIGKLIEERGKGPFKDVDDVLARVGGLGGKTAGSPRAEEFRRAVAGLDQTDVKPPTPLQTARGEQKARLEDAQRELKVAQAREKLLGSDAGQKRAKEQLRLTQELERTQRRVARLDPAQRARAQEEAAEWMQRQGQGAGKFATRASAVGSGAVMGAVAQAGAIEAFPTFTESLKGLSIEVGAVFLPMLDRVSLGLQRASDWFAGLSPETKKTAAEMTVFGIATAAAILPVNRLVTAATHLRGAWTALKALNWTSVIVGGGAVAIGATLVGLLATKWLAVRDAAKEAGEAAGATGRAGGGGPGVPGGGNPRTALSAQDMEHLRNYRGGEFRARIDENINNPAGLRQVIAEFGGKVEEDTQRAREMVLRVPQARAMDTEVQRQLERDRARISAAPQGERAALIQEATARHRALRERVDPGYAPSAAVERRRQINLGEWLTWGGARGLDPARMGLLPGLGPRADRQARMSVEEMTGPQGWQPWIQGLLGKIGLAPIAPTAAREEELQRAYRGLPQPTIGGLEDYGKNLQLGALKDEGDKAQQNIIRQLELANIGIGRLITATEEQTRRAAPAPWGSVP